MTTAHRPTWAPAKGGEEQGGSRIFAPIRQYSAKDAASHTTLKVRYGKGHSLDLLSALLQRSFGLPCNHTPWTCRQTGQATTSEVGDRDLKVGRSPLSEHMSCNTWCV